MEKQQEEKDIKAVNTPDKCSLTDLCMQHDDPDGLCDYSVCGICTKSASDFYLKEIDETIKLNHIFK